MDFMAYPKTNKLSSRIITAFLICGLLPVILVSGISISKTYLTTMNEAEARLNSLRDSKKVAIERYGETVVGQIQTLSSNTVVRQAALRFEPAFKQAVAEKAAFSADGGQMIGEMKRELSKYYDNEFLPKYRNENPEASQSTNTLMSSLSAEAVLLQYGYIKNNPAGLGSKHEMDNSSLALNYDEVHRDIHPSMRQYLETFGYYDIFIVDSNSGDVIYSVYKELDYATNLYNGPYANSGLAEVFKAAKELSGKDQYVMTDYDMYTPSYEAAASFIASPIVDQGRQIGVLVFQLPLDAITSIMNSREGFGETGEAYLVGSDKRLRSDTYKNSEEFNVSNSYKNNIEVDTEAVRLGLAGTTEVIKTENYQSEATITGTTGVTFGELGWAIVVDIEAGELLKPLYSFAWQVAVFCIFIGIGLVFFARKTANSIVSPITSMQAVMQQVAESGDFSTHVQVINNDEVGESAKSFNALLDSLGKTIDEVNQVAGAMAAGDFDQRVTSELNGDLERLKDGINSSAQEMRGIMHSTSEIINAMSKGDFRYRPQTELPGEFAAFVDAMAFIDRSITSISRVMTAVAKGDIDSRMQVELPGQLGDIKTEVNKALDALSGVIGDVGRVLSGIAQGNLCETIDENYQGAYGKLKEDANVSIEKLTSVVEEIQRASQAVRGGAGDIAQGNTNLSDRTERQASSLEVTASSMDEITNTVKNTAKNAKQANDLVVDAQSKATHGGEVVSRAITAMEEINESSGKIAEIISVIDEIAFQTNLLALNASVEAARAGEQGRGFAVVASEVRSLAGRSATAAKEITTLIEDSVNKVKVGSKMVTESGQTLDDILGGVESVTSVVGEIAVAAEEQSLGINEVHRSLEELQTLTQQNTALVEEAAAASNELDDQAASLNSLTGFFQLSEAGKSFASNEQDFSGSDFGQENRVA